MYQKDRIEKLGTIAESLRHVEVALREFSGGIASHEHGLDLLAKRAGHLNDVVMIALVESRRLDLREARSALSEVVSVVSGIAQDAENLYQAEAAREAT